MAGEPPAKIYLMATPSSGKSYFARHNPTYKGVPVVDFSAVREGKLPRAERMKPGSPRWEAGANYADQLEQLLRNHEGPLVVLGRRGSKDMDNLPGLKLGVVLPAYEDHVAYVAARQAENRLRDRWADEGAMEEARDRLAKYAKKRRLPVFTSFEDALEAILSGAVRGQIRPKDSLLQRASSPRP